MASDKIKKQCLTVFLVGESIGEKRCAHSLLSFFHSYMSSSKNIINNIYQTKKKKTFQLPENCVSFLILQFGNRIQYPVNGLIFSFVTLQSVEPLLDHCFIYNYCCHIFVITNYDNFMGLLQCVHSTFCASCSFIVFSMEMLKAGQGDSIML